MTETTVTKPLSPELRTRLEGIHVESGVFERWPDFRVMVIVVDGIDQAAIAASIDANQPSPLSLAEVAIRERGIADWTEHPHIAQWNEAFRDFGAKPKRTSTSVLALLRRVDDGLPRIDPVTDLYNSISVGHVLPIGGEDFSTYVGNPRLAIAAGDEPFDTIDKGEQVLDHPSAGEVIWRDDAGVTCRRWNWRQGVRTRITEKTTTALFILEALGAMLDAELTMAGSELIAGLLAVAPDLAIGSRVISAS
ncbi:MAG: B3/B4 domain-containing protein [Thermomicrobiales bacterium]